MSEDVTTAQKEIVRNFLPKELIIDSWSKISAYYDDLLEREIVSKESLEKWILDRSELEAVLEEDLAWRYIKMNIDTTDAKLADSFNFFVQEIEPKIAPYSDKLNRKLIDSQYLKELDQNKYRIFLRGIKRNIELFREENVPILTKIQTDSQKYGMIAAKMTVEIDGKELTMQQAGMLLKDLDREKRKAVFEKMAKRRSEDEEALDDLFNGLLSLRNQVAKNAGFDNYKDYKFAALGRFDYTSKDCENFHDSIKNEIVPIVKRFNLKRQEKMGLDPLRPWDLEVDISGKAPLKPFEGGNQLLQKTISCFYEIDEYFGRCLETMRDLGHLDLDSKQGKAPGGFNYPLHESGIPFIFMNAVGT
ncbi:MAG: M3 family metallopeptidase, partial [Flavobacteriales bacterium]|nr:M3 family metallopeptidase [Flavobacteriales bacterium]